MWISPDTIQQLGEHHARETECQGNKNRNKTGKNSDWNLYKKLRNQVNSQKQQPKEIFYNNLELSFSDFQTNNKRKVVRHSVITNDSSSTIPPLLSTSPSDENKFYCSDEDKA